MCTLYAISSNKRISAEIAIDGRNLIGYSGHGVCEYQDISAYCKRALPSANEPRHYSVQSKLILAHVRVASIGEDKLVNCHPFHRVSNSTEYVGMAQGTLPYFHKLNTGKFKPYGDTDTERVFLHVLAQIQNQNIGDEWTVENFQWLAGLLKHINECAGFNAIMSDGRYMFCFADKYNSGLYSTEIDAPFDDITLHDDCCKIKITGERNPAVRIVAVSSNPLSCHDWKKLPEGALTVIRDGVIIYSSAEDELATKEVKQKRVFIETEIPMPKKSKEEIRHDLEVFKENLKLILDNEERILQKPQLFHVRLHGLHFGSTTTGCTNLPIGVLLKLWREGHWRTRCMECGGNVYIFQAGGSLLSGRNSYSGCCLDCGRDIHGHAETIGVFARPAIDIMKKYRNRRKIIRTDSQRFSWGKGIEGVPVEDEIIDAGIEAVGFEELIKILKRDV